MRTLSTFAFFLPLLACGGQAGLPDPAPKPEAVEDALSFKMTSIEGEELDLGRFRGQVVLFVNVASRCGFTRQYEGLQRLHERYRERGLVLVGVPSNDFGGQEPGTEAEIAAFCEERFGVTFPMLSKVRVAGESQAPLYRLLTAWEERGPVKWNFEKFLVGRDGQVAGRFGTRVAPEDPELVAALERALG